MSDNEGLRPLSPSQREVLEEAVSSYECSINTAAVEYLIDRGLDQETAEAFRLGFVADPLPGHERMRGWLAIPYLDRSGRPLSVRFRCLAQHDHREYGHGKYLSMTGEPARVFNVRAIHEADDEISVCEGEFDAMVLTKVGLPAVAIPGASGWSSHHRKMLAGFNRVHVWGDPDEAGATFNRKVTQSMPRARAVRLRKGDVTENFLAGGARALLSLTKGDS